MSSEKTRLILASASPRRRLALTVAGLFFDVLPADIDETPFPGEEIEAFVRRMAEEKAAYISSMHEDAVVLAADTIVVLQNEDGSEQIFGKPENSEEARMMLVRLQGCEHLVVTAYCITCARASYSVGRIVETTVKIKSLTDAEIDSYLATGEPLDKAGGYGIQGIAGLFVEYINGSYTNVVGLPMAEVLSDLQELGVWHAGLLELASLD